MINYIQIEILDLIYIVVLQDLVYFSFTAIARED